MQELIHLRLKKLRSDAGLTQTDLAAKMGSGGYTKQAISAIENGRRAVGWNVISDWAKACGKEAEIVFKNIKP
ncbi:helix-turn-helix transcriptional regulator [Pedobacter sp.]|uniref:helix-turn-helix transcriptional regulator n=1 Tax=Pedobacter sp. TaxID=1411316 RepID=UPI003C520869